MTFFSCITLKCVSVNNQECKIRPVVMNINSNANLFYPYNILVNKCSGSCNDINNFNAKLFVPNVVKNMNIKVFNQISRTNETRYACKELIGKGRYDEGFIWNPSKCECDKSCYVGQYLDYESCKCRKK